MINSPTILAWNVANGASLTLLGVRTVRDVKSKIERKMNIPIDNQILVGHKAQTPGLVVKTQPGQTLLLDNELVLNTETEINVIDVYTKITSPRPVEIQVNHMDTLHRLELSSDQTVADLRREIDMKLPMTTYPRHLTTLQAVMSNDDHQLCEYLLEPFSEGFKQVIMVEEEPPSACFICCRNM